MLVHNFYIQISSNVTIIIIILRYGKVSLNCLDVSRNIIEFLFIHAHTHMEMVKRVIGSGTTWTGLLIASGINIDWEFWEIGQEMA